jgi:alpha-N-arabinofuranosidase
VFALNRHLREPMPLSIALPGYGQPRAIESLQLCDADLQAANTREQPDRVQPAPLPTVQCAPDRVRATLQPASWNMIRLARCD